MVSPAPALAAAKETDRPLTGTSTGSLTVSFATGAATSSFTGHLSHLGAMTGGDVATLTATTPATFTYTGTDTLVAANGDEVFSTFTGSGVLHPLPQWKAPRSTRLPAAPDVSPMRAEVLL